MQSSDDRWTFVRCLREDGVEIYLDSNGKLRARGEIAPELGDWIRTHREAIIAELEALRA